MESLQEGAWQRAGSWRVTPALALMQAPRAPSRHRAGCAWGRFLRVALREHLNLVTELHC